jgi:amidophosphoribosyltransferase
VREFIGADSLAYLSLAGLRASCGEPEGDPHYCTSCYTGKYPTDYVDLQQILPADAVAEPVKA